MGRTVGLSRLQVKATSHQYAAHSTRPYIGKNPLMTPEEYRALTRPVCVGRFGTFDTAKPDKKCFDRTLGEVLTKISSGEYRLFCPIARKWVQDSRRGLREMLSIQWIEYYDADHQQIARMNRPKR